MPPNPNEAINDEATWIDLRPRLLEGEGQGRGRRERKITQLPLANSQIVEAQGWTRSPNGEVILIAQVPIAIPQSSEFAQQQCHAKYRVTAEEQPSQENLRQARLAIESLQLAELDNFFQEACLNAKPVQIDKIDTTAAVIYPIILKDKLAVILALPQSGLSYYATLKPRAKLKPCSMNCNKISDDSPPTINKYCAFPNKYTTGLFYPPKQN